jgi:3-dehydroquinate dehydratase type I
VTIKICVSIPPKTIDEALNLIEKAEKSRADFIEVRLDYLENFDGLAEIANHGKVPMIATNRFQDCGGKSSRGKCEQQQQLLLAAAQSGFEYIDIELSTPKLRKLTEEIKSLGVKPIISFHDFNGPLGFSEMQKILRKEVAYGADVCKIVTTAKTVEDNLTLLNFVSKACKSANIVCFAMGELGKTSRLLSPLFGGFFTMASLEKGLETASGQMTIEEIRAAYQALGLI